MHAAAPRPATGPASPGHRTPAGMRLVAIGDIHGHLDLLERLLRLVAEDCCHHPTRRLRLIFLGDFIDRGPRSAQTIDRLMAGPPPSGPLAGAEWITLRGNHEELFRQFLDGEAVGRLWSRSGGLETAQSYLGRDWDPDLAADLDRLRRILIPAVPTAHRDFLDRLDLLHRAGDYAFAHAGIRPGIPLDRQLGDDLMWIRGDFLHDGRPHPAMVVHGHTISAEPQVLSNRIGIDTGAYRTGRLTALVLDGGERRFIQT